MINNRHTYTIPDKYGPIRMTMKSLVTILLSFICLAAGYAQHTLNGTITDAKGQPLQGATIRLSDAELITISDLDGVFMFNNVEEGQYTIQVSYVGLEDQEQRVDLRSSKYLQIALAQDDYQLDEIYISANQLDVESPFSYTQVEEEELNLKNLGQDIPFLLEHTPSMVVTSDAGAGVGYSGLRIRGSDATRVNVTINGVPLNDSESHGVFWVNLPDFASSVKDLQVQRGVGSSTNGSGSFGGTIALNTSGISADPYINLGLTNGSYGTQKYAVEASSGLLGGQYSVEGRFSKLLSDGYIDRASSDLQSFYISAAKLGENHSLRLNVISGDERTYQSWFGAPEARVTGDQEALIDHYFTNLGSTYQTPADSINLFSSDRRYNYYLYDDQVDDYGQDHFQLIYHLQASEDLTLNATAHYTKGRGFFEEFRVDDDLQDYGITDAAVSSSDLVRRRWLDNDFYGAIVNAEYRLAASSTLLFGAGYNRYIGDHFGELISAVALPSLAEQQPYYESVGNKQDFNVYTKLETQLSESLGLYADLQLRTIGYQSEGIDNDGTPIDVDEDYSFFNPKLGMHYQLSAQDRIYGSFAVAHREPVRSDFIDAVGTAIPNPERLFDFELGYRRASTSYAFHANLYFMDYKDQLVVTGAVNDVGGAVRTNVADSYRLGLELSLDWQLNERLMWSPNITFSQNRISEFNDVVVDFADFSLVETTMQNTDIAFSPNIVAGQRLTYTPIAGAGVTWQSKYVGQQFLDNTSNESRTLDAYWVNDLILAYGLADRGFLKHVSIKLMVNNVLSERYASNGYTFSYIFGSKVTENYLYPQAGRHYLVGLDFRF